MGQQLTAYGSQQFTIHYILNSALTIRYTYGLYVPQSVLHLCRWLRGTNTRWLMTNLQPRLFSILLTFLVMLGCLVAVPGVQEILSHGYKLTLEQTLLYTLSAYQGAVSAMLPASRSRVPLPAVENFSTSPHRKLRFHMSVNYRLYDWYSWQNHYRFISQSVLQLFNVSAARDSVSNVTLPTTLVAMRLRILPHSWDVSPWPCLRLEVYGCLLNPGRNDENSLLCQIYYCRLVKWP